jgi:ArsR family transcriptional regulator, arsenate/arsenite/antimonite-responsive transcriptional repressor
MPNSDDRTRAIAAFRFRALGDETRLRILEMLVGGDCSVSELTIGVDVGQSLMSHHLRILREAGLVADERRGRWVHYAIVETALAAVKLYLYELEPLRGRITEDRAPEAS